MSLDVPALSRYVGRQISSIFPDGDVPELDSAVASAAERHARCYGGVRLKGAASVVNHLHTDQYAAFLYFLAHTLFREGAVDAAAKIYALNKALHGLDVFYEVALPAVFAFQHPVGTVLGRGKFADYLFVYQRCSVGSNLDGVYPTFAPGVVMFGGASIIGECNIGPNTWVSVGTTIMDQDVPGDCVVFGRSPHLTVKATRRNVTRDLFKVAS
jgi:serine O-acetyltransferase